MSKPKINVPTNHLQAVLNAKPSEALSKSGDPSKTADKTIEVSKVKISSKPTTKPSNLGFTRSSNRGK